MKTEKKKISFWMNASLYIGSDEGLAKFDRKTKSWNLYNIDNQLSGDQVLSLYNLELSGERLLLVGTSSGLSILKIISSRLKEES